ncbi:hypothetical protein RA086_05675 [Lactiplantibacillus sp. WILCCON 0030]|uniref:Uncharacterized protein n=1 Tax=Lactiplantibacillus brownii TaxID=3069269 RepID=A0ABU1A845_9LACO|nr:hypothetical protein [Lactiplantibacillus brownii]MDQ7937116.1 hypothetical protein [Lactiplantibacillus brownii]
MAQLLYFWDEDEVLDHSELIMTDDGLPDPLPSNSTLIAPANGLFEPIHINSDRTAWFGISKEEWLAAHPAPKPEPTAEQMMLMQQASDITQLKQLAMAQASQIAAQSKGSAE